MVRHSRWIWSLVLAVVVAGCDDMGRSTNGTRSGPRVAGDETPDRVQQQLGDIPLSRDTAMTARLSAAFRAAAAQALPAVVQITTIAVTEVPHALPFDIEPAQQRTQGSGSGFIFNDAGYILTNYHVVRNALNVNVVLLDGREFTAEVIGTDPSTDVAVIRVEPDGRDTLPVIEFGDSDQLRVGDWVLALGNPMGLTFTATAGIVSAKGRSIGILGQASQTPLEAFIQTDAAINPGNSGGPLVDLNGRVVGINTAIESPTGFFAGAGFAIPIALAHKVASDLVQYGVVHRPRLGIAIEDVNAADAEVYSLPAVTGAEITSVEPGMSADRAGLQLGDVILSVNDEPIHTVAELQAHVARFQPGDRINVGYIRYGTRMETTVELGEFESARADAPRERQRRDRNPLGFSVAPLPAQMASRLGLRGENIPVVSRVDPLSSAARARLQNGHVIRSFNGRDVRTVRELERAASGIRSGDVVSLVVIDARATDPLPTIINYRVQ
jgi:serine protease Do